MKNSNKKQEVALSAAKANEEVSLVSEMKWGEVGRSAKAEFADLAKEGERIRHDIPPTSLYRIASVFFGSVFKKIHKKEPCDMSEYISDNTQRVIDLQVDESYLNLNSSARYREHTKHNFSPAEKFPVRRFGHDEKKSKDIMYLRDEMGESLRFETQEQYAEYMSAFILSDPSVAQYIENHASMRMKFLLISMMVVEGTKLQLDLGRTVHQLGVAASSHEHLLPDIRLSAAHANIHPMLIARVNSEMTYVPLFNLEYNLRANLTHELPRFIEKSIDGLIEKKRKSVLAILQRVSNGDKSAVDGFSDVYELILKTLEDEKKSRSAIVKGKNPKKKATPMDSLILTALEMQIAGTKSPLAMSKEWGKVAGAVNPATFLSRSIQEQLTRAEGLGPRIVAGLSRKNI